MRVQRHTTGSVRWDRRRGTWNYLWYEAGKRRSKLIGNKLQYPTKAAAWRAVETIPKLPSKTPGTQTIRTLVEHYRQEKMSRRKDTRRSCEVWIRHYILPKWEGCLLSELQARPVELWLDSLALAPKSKAHIR